MYHPNSFSQYSGTVTPGNIITVGSKASYSNGVKIWQPDQKGIGRLEMFSGYPAEDAKRWIEKFKELATVNKWNTLDVKKVQMAGLLEGVAKGWWEAREMFNKVTWNEIEQAFLAHFDQQQGGHLFHLINSRVQGPNEAVAGYIFELEILFKRLGGNLPESQKIQYLVKGLLPYLQEHLLRKSPFPVAFAEATKMVLDKERTEMLLNLHRSTKLNLTMNSSQRDLETEVAKRVSEEIKEIKGVMQTFMQEMKESQKNVKQQLCLIQEDQAEPVRMKQYRTTEGLPICKNCQRIGHEMAECWKKYPHLKKEFYNDRKRKFDKKNEGKGQRKKIIKPNEIFVVKEEGEKE